MISIPDHLLRGQIIYQTDIRPPILLFFHLSFYTHQALWYCEFHPEKSFDTLLFESQDYLYVLLSFFHQIHLCTKCIRTKNQTALIYAISTITFPVAFLSARCAIAFAESSSLNLSFIRGLILPASKSSKSSSKFF